MMTFHRRLKQRREQLNISIRRICRDLNIPKSSYERWETDSYPRLPIHYKRLAEHLGTSMEYLMYGTSRGAVAEELFVHLERFVSSMIDERLKGLNIR